VQSEEAPALPPPLSAAPPPIPKTKPKRWGLWVALVLGGLCLLAVIGTLVVAMVLYKMAPALDVAKAARTRADIQSLRTSLLAYNGMNGSYPTTEQGLTALVPRLINEAPKDSWNNEYIYRCPGLKNPSGYDLFSAGPDRIPDTADDDWGRD